MCNCVLRNKLTGDTCCLSVSDNQDGHIGVIMHEWSLPHPWETKWGAWCYRWLTTPCRKLGSNATMTPTTTTHVRPATTTMMTTTRQTTTNRCYCSYCGPYHRETALDPFLPHYLAEVSQGFPTASGSVCMYGWLCKRMSYHFSLERQTEKNRHWIRAANTGKRQTSDEHKQ